MKARLWIGLLFIGVLVGLVTTFRVYTAGFEVYAKTDILVWTMPLAAYIFLSLTSSGLAFCCSIPVIFNIKRYEIIEKRTVFLEISVLLGAFVCLILHLGSPLSVFYLILSPNLTSPLWWLATLYGIYLLVLLVSFSKIHSGKPSKSLCATAQFSLGVFSHFRFCLWSGSHTGIQPVDCPFFRQEDTRRANGSV